MFKTADFIFVGLVLAAATATYVVKYGSEIEYNNIAKLEREIETEKEAIDILDANWALLTNPSRIQALAERHGDELQLKNLEPHQVISVDQIPLKPINIPENRSAGIEGERPDASGIITGSIKSGGSKQ